MAMVRAVFLLSIFLCTNSQQIYLKENNRCDINAEAMVQIRGVLVQQERILGTLDSLGRMVKRLEEDVQIVKRRLNPYPDCRDYYINGHKESGVYVIDPLRNKCQVEVYCDMKTDGGGWTVFQRRLDGSEDFYRTWKEYKEGFGDLTAEFWFGNEKLYRLLSQGRYELRMDMSDFNNQTRYVKYSSISIGDEASKYRMSISGYSGDVADCFTEMETGNPIHNMMFSTKDQDNDRDSINCATVFKSGWWHNKCHCSNPNGLYLAGNTTIFAQGITYYYWLTHYYSLKTIQLMVRRIIK